MTDLTRRRLALLIGGAALAVSAPALAAPVTITVYKDPNCGCCTGWVTHLRRTGFAPTVVEQADLTPLRRKMGVPDTMLSCHTAVVGGYFVEGHVPAADVHRLLKEKPPARGIAAPGMPVGSPGMESRDGRTEPYEVMLIDRTGRPSVFARHG